MAFQKLGRAVPSRATEDAWISIAAEDSSDPRMRLSVGAVKHMGFPRAVFFEWDDEDSLVRIVASAPDDPAAYRVPQSRRLRIPGLLASLGVSAPEAVRIHAERDGTFAVIADLSEYVTA